MSHRFMFWIKKKLCLLDERMNKIVKVFTDDEKEIYLYMFWIKHV